MEKAATKAKIIFLLESDENGFPPIRAETINASRLPSGQFEIENAPFFVENVSFGDIVEASLTDDATCFMFDRVVEKSQFTSLSIIILDQDMDAFLMTFFRGLDCVLEYGEFGVYRVLAVAVPPTANYRAIRVELARLEDQGLISFAELAVAGSGGAEVER